MTIEQDGVKIDYLEWCEALVSSLPDIVLSHWATDQFAAVRICMGIMGLMTYGGTAVGYHWVESQIALKALQYDLIDEDDNRIVSVTKEYRIDVYNDDPNRPDLVPYMVSAHSVLDAQVTAFILDGGVDNNAEIANAEPGSEAIVTLAQEWTKFIEEVS